MHKFSPRYQGAAVVDLCILVSNQNGNSMLKVKPLLEVKPSLPSLWQKNENLHTSTTPESQSQSSSLTKALWSASIESQCRGLTPRHLWASRWWMGNKLATTFSPVTCTGFRHSFVAVSVGSSLLKSPCLTCVAKPRVGESAGRASS